MVFCEEDALLRQVNHVGIAGDFREILGTVRKKPTTFEEGKGALTWFSSHIVMNLSKALPGTYAAETAAAVETRNAPNRMVKGGRGIEKNRRARERRFVQDRSISMKVSFAKVVKMVLKPAFHSQSHPSQPQPLEVVCTNKLQCGLALLSHGNLLQQGNLKQISCLDWELVTSGLCAGYQMDGSRR
jgi:hypothetical protein